MHTITAKQLHQETSSVLDQLEKGNAVVVTRNGRPVARLEPIADTKPPRWDDVMAEVWQAQAEVKRADIVESPVLAERKRRRR